jgi:hypothetical protein
MFHSVGLLIIGIPVGTIFLVHSIGQEHRARVLRDDFTSDVGNDRIRLDNRMIAHITDNRLGKMCNAPQKISEIIIIIPFGDIAIALIVIQ